MKPVKQAPFSGFAGFGGGLGTLSSAASDATYVDDVFSTYLYTGNKPSTQTINNGIDLSGEGGMVWIKRRESAGNHVLYDTARGATKSLYAANNDTENTRTGGVTSFNSNGFTLGNFSYENIADEGIVSWTFRKQKGFFDIVTYTGNGSSNRQISHNLGSVPGMILIKNLTDSSDWQVYHRSLGATKYLKLNSVAEVTTDSGRFNDTEPTSTQFTIANDGTVNYNNSNYVAYLFGHDDQSFGTGSDEAIIKCGSYTGDGISGNADGNLQNLGFEPQFLLIKNTTRGLSDDPYSGWYLFDNMRGLTYGKGTGSPNGNDKYIYANKNETENTDAVVNFTPVGFSLTNTGTGYNRSSDNYIYMAIRRPHKPPTAGTDVFAIDTLSASSYNTPSYTSNFPVDFAIRRNNITSSDSPEFVTRITNALQISSGTSVESDGGTTFFDYFASNKGWGTGSGADSNDYLWMFKRAPGFLDVLPFKGTGSALTLTHNLGAVPELVIVKSRSSTYSWSVYVSHLSSPRTKYLYLNGTDSVGSASAGDFWGSSDFTATQISLGTYANTNHSGNLLIAYLFATLDGISKVGSYSGTGSDINVDCGFSSGARFVMIKRTDTEISGATGTNWYIWDSTRGIVSGNDPYFQINTNNAQVSNTDYIDPLSSGFTVTSSANASINTNGGTYIFLAIA